MNGSLESQVDFLNHLSMDEANKLLNENRTGMQKAVDEMTEIREYNLGSTGMVNGSTGKRLEGTAKFYFLLSNRQGLNIATINQFSQPIKRSVGWDLHKP